MAKKRKAKRRTSRREPIQVEAQPVKMFEYTYNDIQVGLPKEDILTQLNALGLEGWLCFHCHDSGGFYHFLFAREVQNTP